jgi:hypothetical protein
VALHAALAARGDEERAARRFTDAERAFEVAGMALHAVAARRRSGELIGGEEGRRVVAEADEWMSSRGVADPTRLAAMLMPVAIR